MYHLPTYQEATAPEDLIKLVSSYLDDKCLFQGVQVCRAWQKALNPFIWTDPFALIARRKTPFRKLPIGLHFISKAKADSIRLFMRQLSALKDSSVSTTTSLVTTFDARPILALKYDPAHHKVYHQYEMDLTIHWALNLTRFLANLRFLVLDGLRVGDSSNALWQEAGRIEQSHTILLLSSFAIKALDCTQVARHPALQNLMFLDISYNIRPQQFHKIFSESFFPNLRILKARGLHLTDSMLPKLILNTGLKLWSLDLRDNLLSNGGVYLLLQHCIRPAPPIPEVGRAAINSTEGDMFQLPPNYERDNVLDHQYQVGNPPVHCRPDDAHGFMEYLKPRGNLLQSSTSVLNDMNELTRATGLTHLYISGNKFDAQAVQTLLRYTSHLQVLDLGSVRIKSNPNDNLTCLGLTDTALPFSHTAGSNVEILRVHHSIITGVVTPLSSLTSSRHSLSSLRSVEKICSDNLKPGTLLTISDNFRLRSLTITDIPTKSYGPIVNALLGLLVACAKQEREVEQARYSLQSRRAPQLLPGLRTLRLEFMAEDKNGYGCSASEDKDADDFLRQSEGDFSFFEEDKGAGESVVGKRDEIEHVLDVLEELKRFRKYAVYQWKGELEIVMP